FYPASLLKLPVALWYFKQAEAQPGYLDSEIQFEGPKGTSIVHYPPPQSVQAGETYSLRQLVELMLQDSDNDATTILSQYAGGKDVINSVYTDLGVADVADFQDYQIDPQTYASFFAVLYSAHYLNRADSNDLLSILAGSDFMQGLRAGVPQSVPIAHKFGEYTEDGSSTTHELHDCGIVYAPGKPYLLCVMSQGPDFDALAAFIATVSKDVYAAITAP
ncbi:MAG TPA: serine hydrolase, partial [Candidatus Paceibacterota bacterium]|nr:serine hydrolase [Candidatus Paceibacterota bacterium]